MKQLEAGTADVQVPVEALSQIGVFTRCLQKREQSQINLKTILQSYALRAGGWLVIHSDQGAGRF